MGLEKVFQMELELEGEWEEELKSNHRQGEREPRVLTIFTISHALLLFASLSFSCANLLFFILSLSLSLSFIFKQFSKCC